MEIDITEGILKLFKCCVCGSKLWKTVELACGHVSCKSCGNKLSSTCRICSKKLKSSPWLGRPDLGSLHVASNEMLAAFEKEWVEFSNQHPNASRLRIVESEEEANDTSSILNDLNMENLSENNSQLKDMTVSVPVPNPKLLNIVLSESEREDKIRNTVAAREQGTQDTLHAGSTSIQSNTDKPVSVPCLEEITNTPISALRFEEITNTPPIVRRESEGFGRYVTQTGKTTNTGMVNAGMTQFQLDSQFFTPWETQFQHGDEPIENLNQDDEPSSEDDLKQPLDLTLTEKRESVPVKKCVFRSISPYLPLDLRITSNFHEIGTNSINIDNEKISSQKEKEKRIQFDTQFADDDDELLLEAYGSSTCAQKQELEEEDDEQSQDYFLPTPNSGEAMLSKKRRSIAEQKEKSSTKTLKLNLKSLSKPLAAIQPKTYVFCPTRLNQEQIEKLKKLCEICNGKLLNDYSKEVTHLILTIDKNGVTLTHKYVFAVAGKKWVLSFDWVEECLRKKEMISEESYECSNYPSCEQRPNLARQSSSLLYDKCNFYVTNDITGLMTTAQIKELIRTLGGTILETLPDTKERLLIVGDPSDFTLNFAELYERHGWLSVSWDWVLDCILCYSLIPFQPKHLLTQGLSGLTLSQARVPLPLLSV